jgi:aflatoxin B1 aldehyde reductase
MAERHDILVSRHHPSSFIFLACLLQYFCLACLFSIRGMKVAIPRAYLGTMTFGWSQTSTYVGEVEAEKMVKRFMEFDEEVYPSKTTTQHHYIDTARIYAGGKTENILGQVIEKMDAAKKASLKVGTKAAPSVQPGGLSPDGIVGQFQASMEAMGLSGCDQYYLHQPDTEHSLLESLKCADSLLKDGKITAIGMSNYHASEMARAFDLCQEHGLTPPSVYQGLYNPLNRLVEEELLPILKKNGCSFIAYNPLVSSAKDPMTWLPISAASFTRISLLSVP